MEILSDVSLEIKDTNSNHWYFEDFNSRNDEIVLAVGFNPLSAKYKKEEVAGNRILAQFNNWAPCEYCQNPVIDSLDAVESDTKFDYILSICPYTAKWRNANVANPRHIYAFYPYSEKIIPMRAEKVYDVIYHGGIHGKEHISALRVMKEFNYRYCSLSYGINKMTQKSLSDATEIDLPFQKKINLIAKSKISIAFNEIHVSLAHLNRIKDYKRQMPVASQFFDDLNSIGILKNYPWIGVLPQFKTRIHEAAISRAINLVKRDAWNVIEDYYEPEKEFLYFENERDLRSKILFILQNWDKSKINDILDSAYVKAQRYTTRNFVSKYDKILKASHPVNSHLFSTKQFWE